ncbi:MAG: N-methylhydantoinase B [Ktedonobacterales bacterium]|jgi:N-methylhydantoinase B|nr:MAG: N-methylhydantoinase B [Ktedonobacterales bacterium]
MSETDINPARLEVFKQLFQSVAEEMGEALMRTGYSPNIKERRDYSCALFDAAGETLAQAEHLPVHLGSMPRSVRAALDAYHLAPGDMVMLNDPYAGGTHLPDVTLVAPVYAAGRDTPAFYVANRAHHADVGGIAPGSLSLASEIYQEGIILPPVKICRAGELDADLLRVFLRNVRTPDERRGDLLAQIAANRTGITRMEGFLARYGLDELTRYGSALQDYAERVIRALLTEIPDGEIYAHDVLDDDGMGTRDVAITLTLRIMGDHATFDFTGSAPQVHGSLNAVEAITLSAVIYALRLAVREDVPVNAGTFRPITLIAPEGTIVHALPPAAVAGGNVETSQRIVDVALAALAQALPDRIPAASQGTMNNVTFGSANGSRYTYYETIGGGSGAGPGWHGTSGVQVHMTNTLNTPIEAVERSAPVRIERYTLRRGSGGAGRYQGGEGIARSYTFLEATEVSMLSERRTHSPYGLAGGVPGTPGANLLRMPDGAEETLPGKFRRTVPAGSTLTILTPGGGGWGAAGTDAHSVEAGSTSTDQPKGSSS